MFQRAGMKKEVLPLLPGFQNSCLFVRNRRDTIQYHGGLQSRELGQAPMLTPRQVLSSHLRVFIMILWESMNFHPDQQLFQVAGARDQTADCSGSSSRLSPHLPFRMTKRQCKYKLGMVKTISCYVFFDIFKSVLPCFQQHQFNHILLSQ